MKTLWKTNPDIQKWKEGIKSKTKEQTEQEIIDNCYYFNSLFFDDLLCSTAAKHYPTGIAALLKKQKGGHVYHKIVHVGYYLSDCLRMHDDDIIDARFYVDDNGEFVSKQKKPGTEYTVIFRIMKNASHSFEQRMIFEAEKENNPTLFFEKSKKLGKDVEPFCEQ